MFPGADSNTPARSLPAAAEHTRGHPSRPAPPLSLEALSCPANAG